MDGARETIPGSITRDYAIRMVRLGSLLVVDTIYSGIKYRRHKIQWVNYWR